MEEEVEEATADIDEMLIEEYEGKEKDNPESRINVSPELDFTQHFSIRIFILIFKLLSFEEKVELLLSLDRCCHCSCLAKTNVAHYSKSVKGINTNFGILAHFDNVQLQDKRA